MLYKYFFLNTSGILFANFKYFLYNPNNAIFFIYAHNNAQQNINFLLLVKQGKLLHTNNPFNVKKQFYYIINI
jgi:hypothetical protein